VTIAGAYYGAARNPSFTIFNESNIPYNDNQEFYVFNKNTEAEAHLASVKWLGNNGGIAVDLKDMVNDYTYNLQFKIVLCDKSITPTEWTPYANICPITGFDSVKVTRTGKNILNDNDFENGYISENGGLVADASYKRTKYIAVDHGKSYTFSLYHNGTAQAKRVHGYDANKNWVSQIGIIVTGTTSAPTKKSISFTIAENIKYIRIGSIVPALDTNIQLEFGSIATDYGPYQGQTYNITFPSEAGTVYGGTLNVLTGELTVDRGITTLTDKTFGNKQSSILSAGGYIIISGFSNWISASKAVISDILQGTVFADRGADGTIAQVNSS